MNKKDILTLLFKKYFPLGNFEHVISLPIITSELPFSNDNISIVLPDWASDIGIGNPSCILVPKSCVVDNVNSLQWENVDWWRALFHMVTCQSECEYESKHGSVHSYASRLPKDFDEQWDYAWVNRIVLFLRRWAAIKDDKSEEELFGKKPPGKIYLTHDVDYVSKTLALRFKQSVFSLYNIVKSIFSGDLKGTYTNFGNLFRFTFGAGKYWQFQKIMHMEGEFDLTSIWNFYGGAGGFKRSFTELVLDPAYRVNDEKLSEQIRNLKSMGHSIGLHQGFYSWRDARRMLTEKKRVEKSLGKNIYSCRQHWLRFSFANTWKSQEAATFQLDTTLGFNERSGFRNSAALLLPAWINAEQRFSETLETLPMVLMDSHLFDYGQMNSDERKKIIDHILDEIDFVGGEATVIWHQRVFHKDYNWGEDYRYLLEGIKSRGLY